MKSELLELFRKHKCDKGDVHHYHITYEPEFKPRKNDEINILEIGVLFGNSLYSWLDYFPNANIYAVDNESTRRFSERHRDKYSSIERVTYRKSNSALSNEIQEVLKSWNVKFDIIIDDGSHLLTDQRKTFNNVHEYLKDDGVYFIEDLFELDQFSIEEYMHPWIQKKLVHYTPREWRIFLEEFDRLGYSYERCSTRLETTIDSCIFKVKRNVT